MLSLLSFYVIASYHLSYFDSYLIYVVLLTVTMVILPFIIISLFLHAFLIDEKMQSLDF